MPRIINGDGTTREATAEEVETIKKSEALVSSVADAIEMYGDDFFDR